MVSKAQLQEVFGDSLYYFLINLPKGEHPIEYVCANAKANVFVSIIDDQVYAASSEHNAIDPSIITQEIE